MARIPALPESEAVDKIEQTYSRLRDVLGVDKVPETILPFARVEPFLRDFFMNFRKFVVQNGALDASTKALLALAAAIQAKSEPWITLLWDRARKAGYSDQQLAEVASLVATNAMYNTFFKFRDLSGSNLFEGMSVGLRAHTFTGTSFDEKTVELVNIVVSDLNACRPCTSGHVDAARKAGCTDEQILEAIQCAAVIMAACQFTAAAG